MTRIAWDKVGERFFEAALDRGVLYNGENVGVPWNGLVSVVEDPTVTVASLYFEGVKYLDLPTVGDYSGTLSAYTYPDEFEEFIGAGEIEHGFHAHGQTIKRFGLSYRTGIGNDVDGIDHGYKIHLVYNLTATSSSVTHATRTNLIQPAPFVWSLDAVPEHAEGLKPTAHIHIDSRKTPKQLLWDIENILYGTGLNQVIDGGTPSSSGSELPPGEYSGGNVVNDTAPRLPSLQELVTLIREWTLMTITDNGDGTWTARSKYDGIIVQLSTTMFQINEADAEYIDENTYKIKTH